jgi:gliding motility-associated-like protein
MKKKVLGVILAVLAWNTAQSQCGQYPVLNLGNDTLLCQGQSLTLNVPSGYDLTQWNIAPGNQPSITITLPTTVVLNVQNFGSTNLVVNGDFEGGNSGFTSAYGPPTGGSYGPLSSAGQYTITTSPILAHNNFAVCSDHTSTGPGNMFVANGADIANTIAWEQTVIVDPNTSYNFSAWVSQVKTGDLPLSQLQFSVNGTLLGSVFSPVDLECEWQQFFQTWNSGANTSATITIVNQNIEESGNDFAMDDISFMEICPQTDTLVVTYDSNTIDAGTNVAFCQNEPQTVTATANYPNPNFTWETGATTPTITPATSGWYTVSAISPSGSGCILRDSVNVSITAMPWGFDTVAAQPTSCGVNDGAVYTLLHGPFVGQPLYTWNGPGANNPNQINASVWQNLGAGWYYIDVENQGCHRTDSILVTTLNPPIAQVSANPTSGYGPLSVTFTNGSSNSNDFDWYFGNGNTNNTTDLSSQNQVYDSVGSYNVILVAINGNCTDTAFVTIVVLPPPIPPVIVPVDIKTPNIFTPNGDHVNDFFTFELLNIKELDVTVVNRWGNPVYVSSAVPFSWDGKDSGGNLVNEGVYFYKYTAKGAQDELFEGQGFVQLFK